MKKFLTKRPYLMFLLPGIIVYSVFVVYPILSAGYISFFRWNGYGPKEFVGLQNYRELFTNVNMMSQLGNALKNCLTIFLLSVIIMMPIQIIMAYIIHAKSRGSGFFQWRCFRRSSYPHPSSYSSLRFCLTVPLVLSIRFSGRRGWGIWQGPGWGSPNTGFMWSGS